MPMDEVIRGISETDSENMQDLLDAVIARYQQLYPNFSLVILTLPKDDLVERERQLRQAWELLNTES